MAVLTTTQSFSDGDTVTAAKLNNIIANTSINDDAVTTRTIKDDAVELAQMADDSVDTGQLVDLAVDNDKLAGMTRGTVKVGNSSGAASDLDAKADNAFLTGDGTDIKSKTFDSATAGDLDITSSAANFVLKIKEPAIRNAMVYDDVINPAKISHSTSTNPGVIVYGASGTPAELTTTATASVLTSNGASAPSWVSGSPAKAWCNFTSDIADIVSVPGDSQVTTVTSAAFNIAVGDHTKDGSTSTGGVQQTAAGTYKVYFTTAMPNTNYIVIGNGTFAPDSVYPARQQGCRATDKQTTYCEIKLTANANVTYYNTSQFELVFFGLTS